MTGATIADRAAALRDGTTTVADMLEATFTNLDRWEPHLRCAIGDVRERARSTARRLDAELAAGHDRGPLHGIPIGVKDLVDIAGVPTTAGSRILADHVAQSTAPAVTALEDAGAIVVAKTNTHEFAFGALTPPTRNPYDVARMPGGSSGGSGAIVGAGIVPAAIGTDTAGSIREPAALCGAVGLKPTRGRLDLGGVVPLAWSLDTIGPIAATPADARTLLAGMRPAGESRPLGAPVEGLAGLSVAVWEESLTRFGHGVRDVVASALRALESAGARVELVALGDPDELVAAALVVLGSEALSYHRPWLETHRDLYQDDVLAYLDLSTTFSAEDLVGAHRLGAHFTSAVDDALGAHHVVLAPGQLVVPPTVTASEVDFDDGTTGPRDLTLIRPLAAFNLSGHPAATMPVCHTTGDGVPVSLQLVGPAGTDDGLLVLAEEVQRATGYVHRPPAAP